MFNLSDKIKDELTNNGLNAGEIEHNLNRQSKKYLNNTFVKCSYCGKFVSRGTVEVFTDGEYKKFKFVEKNGWAKEFVLMN